MVAPPMLVDGTHSSSYILFCSSGYLNFIHSLVALLSRCNRGVDKLGLKNIKRRFSPSPTCLLGKVVTRKRDVADYAIKSAIPATSSRAFLRLHHKKARLDIAEIALLIAKSATSRFRVTTLPSNRQVGEGLNLLLMFSH